MTENKRFTITQDFEEHHRQIRDNGYILMLGFVEPQATVIVDLLNQLNDENEQLKQENHDIKHTIEELYYTYIYEPSEHYDEDSCDKIIRGILKGVEKDD